MWRFPQPLQISVQYMWVICDPPEKGHPTLVDRVFVNSSIHETVERKAAKIPLTEDPDQRRMLQAGYRRVVKGDSSAPSLVATRRSTGDDAHLASTTRE